MEKHLKPKQYYIDLYDKHTVEICRGAEQMFKTIKSSPLILEDGKTDIQEDMKSPLNKIYLWMRIGERYKNKEETIQKWMKRDKEKDLFVENTKAPEDITCLMCGRLMFVTFNYLDTDINTDEDRMLFFYDCPVKHAPSRVFYHTGEEYKPKPNLCIKCKSVMKRTDERIEKKRKVITTETCTNCGHVDIDEFVFSKSKKEKIDPNYIEDRNRFCSDKDGQEYVDMFNRMKEMSEFMQRYKEKEKQKDIYEEVLKIRRLKIIEVEELLIPILEQEKYIRFHFKDPEMNKDLIVSFVTHDSKENRTDRESYKTLTKLINKNLEDTNWRLTGDISYRLGMLEGRLKACEKDGDLMKLVKIKDTNNIVF